MIDKPVKVPQKEITSLDVTKLDGGQYMNGPQDAPGNAFVKSKDVELTINGFMTVRRRLAPFLPDTVEKTYQKFPVIWEGVMHYFVADDGKIKYCREGDLIWSECGGDNEITTNNGGMPKFLRVLNNLILLNGGNGDKICHVNLEGAGFPVIKYESVDNPAAAPTATLANLTTGSQNIYYAFSYSGPIGETELSPILTQSVNKVRGEWSTLTPAGSIELTRTGATPTGAKFWNVYVATAAPSGSIQPDDMLLLAARLDLSTTKFVDDGTLDINLGSPAPIANSTDGFLADQGIVADGNPILWGDPENPYAIRIGGGGPNAMSFSVSDGGYKAEPEKGTNYYPTTVIGFRTGQGVPALTVLYSNTEGLAKQAVLQQQTVNYGDTSFTVWGVTEQHYGAAGVAAPNSSVNYNGKLMFFSTDGIQSAQTQPTIQNVMSIVPVSGPIDPLIRAVKNEAMPTIVGTGWNRKYMWLVPTSGFDTPQKIVVLDTNSKGVEGNGAFYTLDIPAQWIGVVSPRSSAAFVYISQGTKTYKLVDSQSTADMVNGALKPFTTNATGPLLGINSQAHNTWQANVQAMFYVVGLVGEMEIGITYRNLNGRLKTKTKKIKGPAFNPSSAGGYGDPQWTYANLPQVMGYANTPPIDDTSAAVSSIDIRKPVRVDDIASEIQWFFRTPLGFNHFKKIRAISYEGINLGVRPDLQ